MRKLTLLLIIETRFFQGIIWKVVTGVVGGSCRNRTCDQLIKSQLLYQLS